MAVPFAREIGSIQTEPATTKRAGLPDMHFYFFMTLLIAVVVVYGFSHTIGKNLIHPAIPRPSILYVHAAVFSGWLVFFILQSTLIRTHNVAVHRRLGWYGLAHGIAIPTIGFPTAVIMGRFNLLHNLDPDAFANLLIPCFDMFAFSIPFALAICWRKRPEFHRRLILMATCALTAASFGRFPPNILPPVIFYSGVDLLILLGVVRDLIVNRSVHRVYLIGLPALLIGQTVVMYTAVRHLAWWMKLANSILG